jgi:hypothetical protein
MRIFRPKRKVAAGRLSGAGNELGEACSKNISRGLLEETKTREGKYRYFVSIRSPQFSQLAAP